MERTLIDVREYPEFAAGHIEKARLVPLGRLDAASSSWDRSTPLTLVCKSGRRAKQALDVLAGNGFADLVVLDGGMDAWSAAGKPILQAAHRPWAMERQVRTVAGALIVTTLTLGVFSSRYFLIATGIVGAGLFFAGVSNTCMMGSVLALMPWNRSAEERA